MPQHPNNIPVGALLSPAITSTGVQVKTGPGVLMGITVTTAGTGTTVSLYDNTSATGTPIAVLATTGAAPVATPPLKFVTGLYANPSASGATFKVAYF